MSGHRGTGETGYAFLLPDMKDCDGYELDASPAAMPWVAAAQHASWSVEDMAEVIHTELARRQALFGARLS